MFKNKKLKSKKKSSVNEDFLHISKKVQLVEIILVFFLFDTGFFTC